MCACVCVRLLIRVWQEELRAGTNTTAINDERSVNIILSHCRAATRVSTPLRARNYDVLKKAGTWLTVQRMLEKEGRGKDMSWFSTWFAVNGWVPPQASDPTCFLMGSEGFGKVKEGHVFVAGSGS